MKEIAKIGGFASLSRLANSSLREEVSNQKPTMMCCWAIRYPIFEGKWKVGEMKLRDGLHQLVWRGCVGAGLDKRWGLLWCGAVEICEQARGLWFLRENDPKPSSKSNTAPAHRCCYLPCHCDLTCNQFRFVTDVRYLNFLSRRYHRRRCSCSRRSHFNLTFSLTRTGKLACHRHSPRTHYCRSKGRDGHKHGTFHTMDLENPPHFVVVRTLSGLASTFLCTGQFLLPMFRCNELQGTRDNTSIGSIGSATAIGRTERDLWIICCGERAKRRERQRARDNNEESWGKSNLALLPCNSTDDNRRLEKNRVTAGLLAACWGSRHHRAPGLQLQGLLQCSAPEGSPQKKQGKGENPPSVGCSSLPSHRFADLRRQLSVKPRFLTTREGNAA
ncbi:hypothetical protein QBC45DRAFT_241842 [Copromyces sp. CBS 386.78]|nr:hypothetical protein QBC45DRAFT_241842 [Copromyces sp. CBS 386.78]